MKILLAATLAVVSILSTTGVADARPMDGHHMRHMRHHRMMMMHHRHHYMMRHHRMHR